MIKDRDKARYGFHGREDIIREFVETLEEAVEDQDGGILIFQGPPGVGKTALLIELSRIAREESGWKVVDINPTTLKDATELADAAGIKAAVGKRRSGKEGVALKLSGGVATVKAEGEMERSSTYTGAKPLGLLKQIAQNDKGTLLVMDEAQRINRLLGMDAQQRSDAEDALAHIHSGRCGGPVLLLAGGLGHTEEQFSKVGISRFHGGAVTNLDRVSDTASRKIFRGWLTEGARVGPGAVGYNELVEEVVTRSHGWPHHLATYGASARKVLKLGRHLGLPPDVRERILDMGDKLRSEYYRKRAARLTEWERAVIGFLVMRSGDSANWDSIALKRIDNALQERNDNPLPLSDRALASGVLAQLQHETGYHIPIPSMADWLVKQAVEFKEKRWHHSQELEAIVKHALPRPAPGVTDKRDSRSRSLKNDKQGLDTGFGSREQDSGITR